MPIIDMKDMLQHASENGYAVASFEIHNLDSLAGVIEGAEACDAPVILSITEGQLHQRRFGSLMAAIETAAKQTRVPVAIQLKQAKQLANLVRAINAGCNSAMLAPSLDVSSIRNMVDIARGCGTTIGVSSNRAEPALLSQLFEMTGLDCLATEAEFAAQITGHEQLPVPLVVETENGTKESSYVPLIAQNVAVIDYGSRLNRLVDSRIRLNATTGEAGLQTLMQGVTDIVNQEVQACIENSQSAGQANTLLEHGTPWAPIEHLIIFNIEGIDDKQAEAMMAEGRQSLRRVPGVRYVETATAVKEDAKFRFSWLIQFCHPAVIDSYREHPIHVDFADRLFRPVAGDRISIDYQWHMDQPQQDEEVGFNPAGSTQNLTLKQKNIC